MKYIRLILAVLVITALGHDTFGQGVFENSLTTPTQEIGQIYLDMPLVTLPSQIQAYNTTGGFFSSYMNPGMENSLAYSTDFYTATHFGLKKALRFKSKFWTTFSQRMVISLFDVISMQMPLAFSWLHEEYHRGVMTQYGVNSFNEVLLFKLGASSIAVSHEKDEEMAMLCDEHHPDFVRLMSAGHEAVVDLNRELQTNGFFYHQNLDNEVLYWMTSFQNLFYIYGCASGSGDEGMRERNAVEFNIEDRDFTGMDMNAWVDGLWYPEKPYAERGPHPSGNGINRYMLRLAERQIQLAFDQAQKEVDDLHQRTREGIESARLNGMRLGNQKGSKLHVKKKEPAMEKIQRYSRDFDGVLPDSEVLKITGLSRNTYYKYKKELKSVKGT